MKNLIIVLTLMIATVNLSFSQDTTIEQEIIDLSKQKWQWMADKDVDKLAILFHDKSKFVHMSGTWKKDKELEIIKTGSIWYKNADVHDVAVECLAVLQSFGTELRYWPLYVEMKYQMNLR